MIGTATRTQLIDRLRRAGCVFAEDEADLLMAAACTPQELVGMVDRRVDGLPLEQVVGWAEFCSLRIAVEPGVFVPRRRTELLVRTAAALVPANGVVVDVCCGSGAVAAALLAGAGPLQVHAVDIDPAAVRCARRNLDPVGGRAYVGDLFQPLPESLRRRVDVVVGNAPYVPSDAIATMPPEARLHEPRIALDGGDDGLDIQRRVVAEAPAWLVDGGYLLIETSDEQAPHTAAAFESNGFTAETVTSAALDATVVVGRLLR